MTTMKHEGDGGLEHKWLAHTIEVPDCPVCWNHFDNNVHTPRILRCGHTVCEACLECLPLHPRLGHLCILCPECRSLCLWNGAVELPKNFALLQATENRPRDSSHPCTVKLLPMASKLSSSRYSWGNPRGLYGMAKKMLWEATRLSCLGSLLFVFVSLSLAHVILGWLVAILGFFILVWFLVGGFGLGVFVFCFWCSYNITHMVSRLNMALRGKRMGMP